MDAINKITNYFKLIAEEHLQIRQFHVGEDYEMNDSNVAYPILRLLTPFDITYPQGLGSMTVGFSIGVYSNQSFDQYGNSTPTTEYHLDDQVNQLNYCMNILNSILERIEDETENHGWQFSNLNNLLATTQTRVANDDLSGVECRLTLDVPCTNLSWQHYFKPDDKC
jgi:hypothetical protein